MQPKFFLMENVRGLMSAALRHRAIRERPEKGGSPLAPDEEPGSVVRLFVEDLHGAYRLDIFEVNAVNYGAPQLRERVLFVGNRLNHLVEFPAPTHGVRTEETSAPALFNTEGAELLPFRTLRDALEHLHDPDPVILDFSPRKKGYLHMIPPGSNWRSLPPEIAEESMGRAYFAKGGRSGWWRRLTFDLPCPTIVTMPNHASTSLCHPTETRALTLRECARIQEFPDDWEFVGSPSEQFAQAGNAVPTRLGTVAGHAIASHLDRAYENGLVAAGGENPAIRQVYLQSHIRTRQWYRNGRTYVWGADEEEPLYAAPRTIRKETARERAR
jgi:DNA (cytosine-5)-methyltransferase 1